MDGERGRHLPARVAAIVAAVVMLTAGFSEPARAAVSGTTQLITRPSGDLPVAANGTGPSGLAFASSDGATQAGKQTSTDGRYIVFVSEADDLAADDVDTIENVHVRDTVANTTEFVGRATGANGGAAGAAQFVPAISDDGSTVAFATGAALDPADTDGGFFDVYVRRLSHHPVPALRNTTVWVPVGLTGNTLNPALDEDGSHVAVETSADLDAKDANGGKNDVYVWEVGGAGVPVLASRLDGADTAALDDHSTGTSLSDDGTVVAFETSSAQLDAGDANATWDIAVRDLDANTTELASRAAGPAGGVGSGRSSKPGLNGDGTVVAFRSEAANLVGGDGNGDADVFVRRLAAHPSSPDTIVRASLTSAGLEIDEPSGSDAPSISGDGNRVAFTNAQFGVTPDDGSSVKRKAYVRVLGAGLTALVSRPTGSGTPAVQATSTSISANGRVVAFGSPDDDASDEDDDSQPRHVHARRLADFTPVAGANTTLLVARPTGTAPFTGISPVDRAAISAGALSWDGRYVGFVSDADDLAPGLDPTRRNGFVRDTQTGTTAQVNGDLPGSAVGRVVLSADGRLALFATGRAYVRDLAAGEDEVVSRRADGTEVNVSNGGEIALSGDGRRAAFLSSQQLVPEDTNLVDDVYVRDLTTGTTILASVPDDEAAADGASAWPTLDWDGSHVAFESVATNMLGPGADLNGRRDVFVRDLQAGTTAAASRADGPSGDLGDQDSRVPSIDGDGRRVAFSSEADNLGGPGGSSDVFVRDLGAGTTQALGASGIDLQPTISEDGTRVAFVSGGALAAGDTSSFSDVYVHGPTGYVLASRADGENGAVGNASSGGTSTFGEGPAISGDGNCVALPSLAGNLDVSGWTGNGIQLGYLRVTGPECPDTTAPDTAIDAGPSGETSDTTPEFAFSASERRARFECAVDGEPYAPCTSPVSTAPLAAGVHTFRVRARDVPGNLDATPAERAFTVAGAAPPPPVPPAPAPPGAAPPPAPPATPSAAAAPAPKDPAKLKVLRAGVEDGVLDMLVEITSNAVVPGADLDVAYESSGRTTRFSVPLSSGKAARRDPVARVAEQRITIRRTLPKTQPKDTGIVEIEYAGNDRVQPDEVRLRAASVKALLVRKTASLSGGRLKMDGTIGAKAKGVVRVRLGFAKPDGSTGFETYNATIAKGAWKIDRTLTGDAAKGGYVSIQFTGYEPENMRGEQTGKAVP